MIGSLFDGAPTLNGAAIGCRDFLEKKLVATIEIKLCRSFRDAASAHAFALKHSNLGKPKEWVPTENHDARMDKSVISCNLALKTIGWSGNRDFVEMTACSYIAPTALMAAVAAVFAAVVAALAQSYLANAETRRQQWQYRMKRRGERQETYQTAINLLTDWGWRSDCDPSFSVVSEFTIPFVRAANNVRVYGSPESVAAMDEIQDGFAMLNRAQDAEAEAALAAAHEAIRRGHDHFVMAARDDVGPRKDDGLRDVLFRPGAGPPT